MQDQRSLLYHNTTLYLQPSLKSSRTEAPVRSTYQLFLLICEVPRAVIKYPIAPLPRTVRSLHCLKPHDPRQTSLNSNEDCANTLRVSFVPRESSVRKKQRNAALFIVGHLYSLYKSINHSTYRTNCFSTTEFFILQYL